ncbi:uncharacterized protein [Miscanthus floridulus]|uniref:uncharacterized protein n=1 Tax=Miscanthus floridulus TaxID=154761 RepID=UPI003458E9A1
MPGRGRHTFPRRPRSGYRSPTMVRLATALTESFSTLEVAEVLFSRGVPSAESSRSVQGLGKGVSGKPYPHLCNARRPRLEPGTFWSQAIEDDGNDIICLPIDFQQLQEMCVFIKDKLNESPKEALLCVGVAADLALRSSKINKIFLNAKFNKINIRFYNTGRLLH